MISGCPYLRDASRTAQIVAKSPAKKKGEKGSEISCPECGKPMVERKGKKGKFLGCSGYPDCGETAPIELTKKSSKKCSDCGKVMVKRKGKKGEFYGCSGYPDCKHTEDVKRSWGNKK